MAEAMAESEQASTPLQSALGETNRIFCLLRQRRRHSSTTLYITGLALTLISVGMGICVLLELLTSNRDTAALAFSTALSAVLGAGLWYFTKPAFNQRREVFTVVAGTWITVTVVGALPFVLAGTFAVAGTGLVEQIVNSVFESASGFSCTGSTALIDFERPGRGLLMYRQATQWYGGMGVVVLAVAVLPFLRIGGLDLISAEAPGPGSSDRLTPRVSETARRLWIIYGIFTLLLAAVLLAIPGPSLYDAVAHAFSTASTGGFSPYPDSIGHFGSVAVEVVLIVAMIAGGTNFTLHWRAVTRSGRLYHRNSEFRSYLFVLAMASAVIVGLLWVDGELSFASSLRAGLFNAVSLGTSTGFGNATGAGSAGDFVTWIGGAQLMLLFLMVIGGCAGSTSGGIKVMRLQILGIVMVRSVRHAQRPRAVIPVKLGSILIPAGVVSRVVGFFLLHLVLLLVGFMVVTTLGGDLHSTLGAVISALGNMGPALNEAGPTAGYSEVFSQPARLVLALLMVIGRLEIFPVLLMFVGAWQGLRRSLPRR